MTKPTILVVPGSFSPRRFYFSLVDGLRANGFDAFVYDLPSASRKPGQQAATLAEDTMFFNGVLHALCDAGKDVVVLGHSYGGFVASGCVEGLTERSEGRGRALGLIYLTAIVPLVGDSSFTLTGHLGMNFIQMDGDFLYHDPLENSVRAVFSDMSFDEGLALAKQMPYHSALSFQNEQQYAPYKDVEQIAYIFCSEDKCLPPNFQQDMIKNAKSGGKPVEVYELASGHCPNASQPEKLVEVVKAILEKQYM